MTEVSAAAHEAAPEGVIDSDAGKAPEPKITQDGDQTEGDAPEQDAEGEGGESHADAEKKSRSQERRERDKALKRQLHEERDLARRELERLEERQQRIVKAGESSVPPKESDFKDYSEFVAAQAVWKYGQEAAKRDASMVSEETAEARKRLESVARLEQEMALARYAEQVADARSRYADFDRVVGNPTVPIPQGVAEIIVASDQAADVAYYVASNPALAAEIAQMPQVEAARAIGRIEASLSAPRPRTQTSAPDPITPVKAKTATTKDPAKMSMAEYKKWRDAGGTFTL